MKQRRPLIISAADPTAIDLAADILRAGGLVAYPTDTVYGLAVDPANDDAVRRLFEAKGRDPRQSTPLLLADAHQLPAVCTITYGFAQDLATSFWPGPLTLILPKAQIFVSRAIAGESVGVRVPDHPVPRALARLLARPITGTSANRSGGPEPHTAADVRAQLGDSAGLIIDGGRCPGSVPSTVVDCTVDPPRIIRAGAIAREQLERVAKRTFA